MNITLQLVGKQHKRGTSSEENIFIGKYAGVNNVITGSRNTVIGSGAGGKITSGSFNVYLGRISRYEFMHWLFQRDDWMSC